MRAAICSHSVCCSARWRRERIRLPAAGVVDTISAIQRTPLPPHRLTTGLTHDARAIILKLLQRDPADRYQTSAELPNRSPTDVLGTIDVPARARVGEPASQTCCCDRGRRSLLASRSGNRRRSLYRSSERRHWVREQAIPEVVKLAAADKGVEAFRLIEEAEKYAPGDPDLGRAVASATRVATCALDSSRCARRGRGLPLTDEQVAPAGESTRSIRFDCQPATCDGRSRSLASASCSRHRWPATR